jgi:hypothetical protein
LCGAVQTQAGPGARRHLAAIIWLVQIRFTLAALKHGVDRASVRYVLARSPAAGCVTRSGTRGFRYQGKDEGGRELEIIVTEERATQGRESFLLVIHAMPTNLRRKKRRR